MLILKQIFRKPIPRPAHLRAEDERIMRRLSANATPYEAAVLAHAMGIFR